MKICILTHTFPKNRNDSTAAFLHPLVCGLQKLGHVVTVITPYHPDLRPETFPYKVRAYRYIWPDRLHILGYSQTLRRGAHLPVVAYLLAPLLVLFGVIQLLQYLRRESIDVISVHWILPGGIIAALATRFFRIPFTVTLAGSDVFIVQKNKLFSAIARYIIQKAAIICSDSPEYLRELVSAGVELGATQIIPYPVEASAIRFDARGASNIRRILKIAKETHVLMGVGRLIEKKGFFHAISALPVIIKQIPNTLCIFVGDGDLRQELEQQVHDLKISRHVRFVGAIGRDVLPSYYSMADIVLVPSIRDHEGNLDDRPVVLVEAMSCGRAVVASHFPGNALTIRSGTNGILIPEKDSRAISQAVIWLLKHPFRRRMMGKKARERIVKDFDTLSIAQKYTTVFSHILKES